MAYTTHWVRTGSRVKESANMLSPEHHWKRRRADDPEHPEATNTFSWRMCCDYACRAGNNSKGEDTHIHTYVQHCVCVVQQLAQRGTGLREQRGRQGLRAAAQKRVSTGTHAVVYVHTHTHTRLCVLDFCY